MAKSVEGDPEASDVPETNSMSFKRTELIVTEEPMKMRATGMLPNILTIKGHEVKVCSASWRIEDGIFF